MQMQILLISQILSVFFLTILVWKIMNLHKKALIHSYNLTNKKIKNLDF